MANVKDLFGSSSSLLEEVIILPFRGGSGTGGVYPNGTYSLPAGYSWTDFEYVEFYAGDVANSTDSYNTVTLTKDATTAKPTSWQVQGGYNDSSTNYYVRWTAVNNFQFTTSKANSAIETVLVKGYRRRYATQNVAATVNVNGGANIGVGQRYEIDIATELGADYVGKKLIVEAEIYNNSGEGTPMWFPVSNDTFFTGAAFRHSGLEAVSNGTSIFVSTAGYQARSISGDLSQLVWGDLMNVAGAGNITSTPCRVNVWKVDRFVTNTAGSGGGGKTVLWAGTATSGPIPLNDDLSKYDAVIIEAESLNSLGTGEGLAAGLVSSLFDTDSLLARGSAVLFHSVDIGSGSSFVALGVRDVTGSSMTISYNQSTFAARLTRVVGINYSS